MQVPVVVFVGRPMSPRGLSGTWQAFDTQQVSSAHNASSERPRNCGLHRCALLPITLVVVGGRTKSNVGKYVEERKG